MDGLRTKIGLAVTADAVTAVAIRGRRLLWSLERQTAAGDAATAIDGVIASLPAVRWREPQIIALIGPHASDVKVLRRLPMSATARQLGAAVRENSGRFFLGRSAPLHPANVVPLEPGAALAAVVERDLVDALWNAVAARGWRLAVIAPVAVGLARAMTGNTARWSDGEIQLELTKADGRLIQVLRSAAQGSPFSDWTLPVAVPAAPPPTPGFIAAVASTMVPAGESLAIEPGALRPWHARGNRQGLIVPAVVTVAAIALLLLSPLRSRWLSDRATVRAVRVTPAEWTQMTAALSTLDTVSARLESATQFVRESQRVTPLLAALTDALPDSAAISRLVLRLNSADVEVVTSDSAGVVARLRGVPALGSIQVTTAAPSGVLGAAGTVRLSLRLGSGLAVRYARNVGADR